MSYLNEVDVNLKNGESFAKQNNELKDQLKSASEENQQLATELSQKKNEIRDLNEKVLVLNSKRRLNNDDLSKDMISQTVLVKTKYEVK
jgi:predicted nuclease with TOPRIM domain